MSAVRVVDGERMMSCCAEVLSFIETIVPYLDDLSITPVGCVPTRTKPYTDSREKALAFNADSIQWENFERLAGGGILPFQDNTRSIECYEALYLLYVGSIDASTAAMLILGGHGGVVESYFHAPRDFYQRFWIEEQDRGK